MTFLVPPIPSKKGSWGEKERLTAFYFAGSLTGQGWEDLKEVWRPDPDILELTARPQLLVAAPASKWEGEGEPTQPPKFVDGIEAVGKATVRTTTIVIPRVRRRTLKRKIPQPPQPPSKGRSAIGPPGCDSRTLDLEKAHGRR